MWYVSRIYLYCWQGKSWLWVQKTVRLLFWIWRVQIVPPPCLKSSCRVRHQQHQSMWIDKHSLYTSSYLMFFPASLFLTSSSIYTCMRCFFVLCSTRKTPITAIAWAQLGATLPEYMDCCYQHVGNVDSDALHHVYTGIFMTNDYSQWDNLACSVSILLLICCDE